MSVVWPHGWPSGQGANFIRDIYHKIFAVTMKINGKNIVIKLTKIIQILSLH